MDPIIQRQYIASLILKKETTGLTDEEQCRLQEWRNADSRNEDLYQRLRVRNYGDDLRRYAKIDVNKGWQRYCERYACDGQEGTGQNGRAFAGLEKGQQSVGRRPKVWKWSRIAAVAALLVGFWGLLMLAGDEEVVPGGKRQAGNHAILVLSDGQTVDLSKRGKETIVNREEVAIRYDEKELSYSALEDGGDAGGERYNEVIIPKGGELVLALADGSKVWLNSQTKLKYPTAFHGRQREVYLEGEAYFEVAKNRERPFYVHTGRGVSVEVLGTSFNVRSYADERHVETVLEEGSVRMRQGADSVVLVPGQQAVYRDGEKIRVATVNTEQYTAWRQGEYVFVNERLEDILKQLARWYDLEVFYSNEGVKDVVISGDVKRYDDIGTLLEALEVVGDLNFTLTGRTLVVNRR